MDKPITLVNTATGARYQIKLVYTGTAPEAVAKLHGRIVDRPTPSAPPTTTGSSTVNVAAPSK